MLLPRLTGAVSGNARCVVVVAALTMLLLAGCPDTGHLRAEPDWTMQGESPLPEDDAADADDGNR